MDSPTMELVLCLRKKYTKLNEILDITKQLGESLNMEDEFSFKLMLNTRKDLMLETDSIDYKIDDILKSLSNNQRERINLCLKSKVIEENLLSKEEELARDIYTKSKRLLEKTIALDDVITKKLKRQNSSQYL